VLPRRRVPELVREVVADIGRCGPSVPVFLGLAIGPASPLLELQETFEREVAVVEAEGSVAVVPEVGLEAGWGHEVAVPDHCYVPWRRSIMGTQAMGVEVA
jgi:hypothetical protein